MNLFTKRETLTQNIAYMGIMAAINVIFVVMTYFIPFLLFVLVFVLPLTSAIVTLFCKKKYFPIYAIATISICLLVTINNFTDTLFYVIPSIFSGFAFGFMAEKKVPVIWIIFVSTVITLGFSSAFIPLIKFIYGTDIVETFAKLFNLTNFSYKNYLIPLFLLFISFAQTTISYIVIKTQLPKLGFDLNDNIGYLPTYICAAVILALEIVFIFVVPSISYLFMIGIMYFSIFVFIGFAVNLRKIPLILSAVSLVIGAVIFISTYKIVPAPLSLHVLNTIFVLILIIGFVDNSLILHSSSIK